MPYFNQGNPHLDEFIAGVINPAGPPVSGFVIPPGGGYGFGPPKTPWDGMITNPGGGRPAPIMPRFFPPVAAGMAGILAALYSSPVGEGSDFGYSSNLKGQDLEGRKLYPMPKQKWKRWLPLLGPRPSTRYTYGGGGKPTKKKSQWQKSQERRAAKRAEEEEERARQRQRMMQAQQSRYSRPNTIPESLWKAYVPDEGMSNFSIWDDKGRYVGLDVGGLLEAIGVKVED